MTHCLVWFNGPSSLDLHKSIPPQDNEIGCNYIRQHRPVNRVVVFDHALRPNINIDPGVTYYGCNGHKQLPTWQEVLYTTLDQPHNSGLLAVRLAMNLKFSTVYILGCDWGLNNHSIFDAQYKKTQVIDKMSNPSKKLLERWGRQHDIVLVGHNPAGIRIRNITVDDLIDTFTSAK
jgi:hypothetical protein